MKKSAMEIDDIERRAEMIKKLDHITINAKDIEATRRFYVELLRFSERKMFDAGNHRYYFFDFPGGITLEVGVYDFNDSEAQDSSTAKGKLRHIAFEVDDIMGLQKRLEDAGYSFSTTVEYRGDQLGFISGQIFDPNGIELEFLQYGNAKQD